MNWTMSASSSFLVQCHPRPGELKFGSTGIGTGTHVGMEKFNQMAGIKASHVPPLPTDSNANTMAIVIAGRTTYCRMPIKGNPCTCRKANSRALF
jgi:tripartite-type tricarboxylate transporter receptor subunit TctC